VDEGKCVNRITENNNSIIDIELTESKIKVLNSLELLKNKHELVSEQITDYLSNLKIKIIPS
jgi:hypothetical protein